MVDRTEEQYREELLAIVSEPELNEWLRRNPPPADWLMAYGKYAFAYEEMPTSSFLSWWRKVFLGYKI